MPQIEGPLAGHGGCQRIGPQRAGEFWAAGDKLPGRDRAWVGVSPWLS